jgi:hypothetical protein
MTILKLAAVLSLILAPQAQALPVDPCQFYLDREQEAQCGPQGYYVEFGHRFCTLYSRSSRLLSARGQRWMEQTRECLIRKMQQEEPRLACSQVPMVAQDHHASCYAETGYCNLSLRDRAVLMGLTAQNLRDAGQLAGLFVFNLGCALR